MIVGPTHEDIYHIFSVLLSCLVRLYRLHTLDELVLEIHIVMRKVFVDRLEVVSVVLIGEVFDFGAWLDAQGVHLHNAWVSHDGVDAPHSFCYKMREDLNVGELENVPRRPSAHPPHQEDTFCIVKRWMHLHQAAGLVLSSGEICMIALPWPSAK